MKKLLMVFLLSALSAVVVNAQTISNVQYSFQASSYVDYPVITYNSVTQKIDFSVTFHFPSGDLTDDELYASVVLYGPNGPMELGQTFTSAVSVPQGQDVTYYGSYDVSNLPPTGGWDFELDDGISMSVANGFLAGYQMTSFHLE